MYLLAFLLTLGLPQVQASNRTKRQERLNCHVCEAENSFQCTSATNCMTQEKYCLTSVIRVFARFFMITKQCSNFCPLIEIRNQPKPFILVKAHPLPFLYIKCCQERLCNENGPPLKLEAFREHTGRAGERRHGNTVFTLLLAGTATFIGPSLLWAPDGPGPCLPGQELP